MKRTISVILTVLLLVSSAFALVACSGVETEADWNEAIDLLKTCDAITIKTNEKSVYGTGLDKTTDKIKMTVAYDAKNGILNYYSEKSPYSALGFRRYTSHEDNYFIVEGSDVKIYTLSWMDKSNANKTTDVEHYDSAEAAKLALREKYLAYLQDIGVANLPFDAFEPTRFGRFQALAGGSSFLSAQVTFFGGKLTKYRFDEKLSGKSSKGTTKVQYRAKISLPEELSDAK